MALGPEWMTAIKVWEQYGVDDRRLVEMVSRGVVRTRNKHGLVYHLQGDIEKFLGARVEVSLSTLDNMADDWMTYEGLVEGYAIRRGWLDKLVHDKKVTVSFVPPGQTEPVPGPEPYYSVKDVMRELKKNIEQTLPAVYR